MQSSAEGTRTPVLALARGLMTAFVVVLALGFAQPAAEAAPAALHDPATALRDYLAAEDEHYRYGLVDSDRSGDGYTAHILRMTSQQWRARGAARPAVWRHWLVVIVPDNVSRDVAALVVAGGARGGERPSLDDDEIRFGAQLAVLAETAVAVLMQVPEQPLSFPDERFPHKEDALVAYSWNKVLETGDYSWPVYLPMVKATVRAMDTVEDFVPSVAPVSIARFVVVGASKRGAAAWLTAAADTRVEAVAPMAIDMLNFSRQMEHHLAVYGAYAPALADYVSYGLVQRVDTPEGQALTRVIDPYAYLDALDMPKYIINSTGDQFFPPDSAQFYFGDLPGENLLRYVPNSGHSLGNTDAALIDAVSGLFGWYLAVVNELPRPAISWRREGDKLIVTTSPRPLAARLWRATNAQARDFRLGTTGEAWRHKELAPAGRGRYVVSLAPARRGWQASLVELVYPSPLPGLCQVYSTRVFVTPDVRPFEGAAARLAGDEFIEAGGDPGLAEQGDSDRSAGSIFDQVFRSIADDVHEKVLEEGFDDGDLPDRAVRYCFAQDLDDFDEALEVYARLGTGRSFDNLVDDRLQDLLDEARDPAKHVWGKVREGTGEIIDDIGAGIDTAVEEAGDFIDDGVGEAGAFIGDQIDAVGDFADRVF